MQYYWLQYSQLIFLFVPSCENLLSLLYLTCTFSANNLTFIETGAPLVCLYFSSWSLESLLFFIHSKSLIVRDLDIEELNLSRIFDYPALGYSYPPLIILFFTCMICITHICICTSLMILLNKCSILWYSWALFNHYNHRLFYTIQKF